MTYNPKKRFEKYHQVKKVSTEVYVKEKFRLFVLWRLTSEYYHETKRLFNFPNRKSADAFFAKWQNGDFDVPSARGTIFSKPPATLIDPNLFSVIFFISLKDGLRKKCVQQKLSSWFTDLVGFPTFEETMTKAAELEEQRKSEKRERKLVRQQLIASMQQHLIDNIRLNFGN